MSASVLKDPYHYIDIDTCQRCNSFIFYSQVQRRYRHKEDWRVQLKCGVCQEGDYFTKDVSRLTLQQGYPSVVQPFTKINDVSPGDLISYHKIVTVLRHRHYAIVTKVDYENDAVTVVEFVPHFPLRWGRVNEEQITMKSIDENGAWIFRFMPFDCLPTIRVLENAKRFLNKDESKWPFQFGRKCNTQHFASWCKLGETLDLNQIFPSSWYRALKERLELVQEIPATFYIGISNAYTQKLLFCTDLPVLDKCTCGAEFDQSSMIDANEAAIELKCSSCKDNYLLANVTSQKEKLMKGFNQFTKERVFSFKNISEFDVLIFDGPLYEHHGVITDEDIDDSRSIMEYCKNRGKTKIKKQFVKTRKFVEEEVRKNIIYVKRYLPFDCLPFERVRQKLKYYEEQQPEYNLVTNNCQHMATHCKTGIKKCTAKKEN